VPETLRTSCHLPVFVEEPAEAVVSMDLADVGWRGPGEWPCGGCLPECAVWTVIVVVACELAQQGCGVPLVDDQDPVEEFAADVPTKRSAIAFARGARGSGVSTLVPHPPEAAAGKRGCNAQSVGGIPRIRRAPRESAAVMRATASSTVAVIGRAWSSSVTTSTRCTDGDGAASTTCIPARAR